ncbi:Putative Integral membrane protein [Rhizopus microsporus]|nr:Putative Integral membrane protein [Rhizopus microsporus]
MAVLAGIRSPAKLKATVKAGLLPMQKVSWVVSPLTLLFAQNFLPPTTWVPFFNLVAFVFGTYINTMVKRKRISEEAAKKD